MREIKFRGVCINSGAMVYGDFIHGVGHKKGNFYILPTKINLAGFKFCDPLDGVKVSQESIMQFTGFTDSKGVEIYEGDILSEWVEVDGEAIQSKLQVFWCEKTGAWMLDASFNQDKSTGDLLSEELIGGGYEVIGNIFEEAKNNEC